MEDINNWRGFLSILGPRITIIKNKIQNKGRVALDASSFNLLGINYLLFSLFAVFYLRNKQPPCQRAAKAAKAVCRFANANVASVTALQTFRNHAGSRERTFFLNPLLSVCPRYSFFFLLSLTHLQQPLVNNQSPFNCFLPIVVI